MMRLISNGEPYVYTHRCTGSENRGDIMTMEGVHRFLVETLYESFLHCGSNIKKIDERKKYNENAICKAYGKGMMLMPIPFVLGGIIDIQY